MKAIRSTTGFLFLFGTMNLLFFAAGLGTGTAWFGAGTLLLPVWGAAFYGIQADWHRARQPRTAACSPRGGEQAADFGAVIVGAAVTYTLSRYMGLDPVPASAVVGVIAGLWLPRFDSALYCGSFVGMASSAVFPDYPAILAAAAAAAVVYLFNHNLFPGHGGRLGAAAFAGSLLVATALSRPLIGAPTPEFTISAAALVCTAAAVITNVLHRHLPLRAAAASGLVGISAYVLFAVLLPEKGSVLAAAAFCATFAGMTSAERMPSLLAVSVSGCLSAVLFVLSAPYWSGPGGRLGTIAFAAAAAVHGLSLVLESRSKFLDRRRGPKP